LSFYISFSAGFSDPRFHYATTMVRTPHYQYQVTSTYACPNFTSVEQAAALAKKVEPEPDPELEAVLEYTKKISDTSCTVASTLTDIGEIALEDNPRLGAMIIAKLQDQVSEGSRIFGEFTASTGQRGGSGASGKRVKRQASEAGNAALNKVGDVLTGATGKIDGEMKKLSAKAQKKISKKNKDGLDKCRADSCKAASKLLASGDDDDRQ
jgi:hypothetical protein